MSANTTRRNIVDAADTLFYRQGFEHTSFAHIADAVQISRGNFYHHFKSKDEILQAVIESRIEKTRAMLDQWAAQCETPQARIRSFIHILVRNKADIQRHGCPVGTLYTELAKLDHAAKGEAAALFTLFRTWLREQFESMGCKDADALALHLLARSQGVATLANAFQDEAFIRREVQALNDLLDAHVTATAGTP